MSLPFPNPDPSYRVRASREARALDDHFHVRGVPRTSSGKLLVASWNLANLGAQGRTRPALRVMAHLLARFDLIAVQEVNEDFRNLLTILSEMGPQFRYVFNDTAGNEERLAFIYRHPKVQLRDLWGEVALRDWKFPKRTVKVRYRTAGRWRTATYRNVRFRPFDRNPFIGSFRSGGLDFTLVNVHLYFGDFQNSRTAEERRKYARRVLEIYALSHWADQYQRGASVYDTDVLLLGDMNVPAMTDNDEAYQALISFDWQPLGFTRTGGLNMRTGGTNIGNNKTYDQMVFAPGPMKDRVLKHDVFDFDSAVFRNLWNRLDSELSRSRAIARFNLYVKHHLSDHRPIWIQLDTT